MSEAVKLVPSSMESETKGVRKTDLLEMFSKSPPQAPDAFLDEEKETEKPIPFPANQLIGIWEGTAKPHDSRQKSWTWSECHLRVASLSSPLPLSILRTGEDKSTKSDNVANLRIRGSGVCKLDGEEKSERFMIFGIMDSSSGYLELYFTLNKAELPATVVFLGRAQFDPFQINAISSESRLTMSRKIAKEPTPPSPAPTSAPVTDKGRRGRRNSETLTTSDLLGTRTPLIDALLYEAPVFTGPFTHFLKTPMAASGLMSGTTEGDSQLAPLGDLAPLSGIWEGHSSTFALKETVALFDINLLFKQESQIGIILGKGTLMHQHGTHPILFRGSFSPFLQFGFVWAHLGATIHPAGAPVRSFQLLAKLDISGKVIEAHDHNTAVYLSYQGPTTTPLQEQDFVPMALPVPVSESTSSVSASTPASSPPQPIPQHIPIPEVSTPFYAPTPISSSHRRASAPIGDPSIDPLISSFSHLQMMGSSFPPHTQPLFHEPSSTFPPTLPLIDPSHPSAGTSGHQQFTSPAQPPFHSSPQTTPTTTTTTPTDKTPRTNPHHVLQTLRDRPPSPMSIIPESTPDLPQAPHINKAFVTKEGTLKSPLVNPEEDSNRQPRRLSAARAALTVSMYTMPRWLTLPLYLRCLVSTNSTHPYPYTHPSQLHPATRRRRDSTTSSSDSRGGSRRGSTSSQTSIGRAEKPRRRRNRVGGKKSRPTSPRPLFQSYPPTHTFAS